MSQRIQRVDELLREEISRIVTREIEDPRIGFVTFTRVDASADLRHATVWASIIGSEAERRASLRALGRAMPYVRHRLGELRLRRIPELHLRLDDSVERGTRVMTILQELQAGHEPPTAPTTETLPTPRRGPIEPEAERSPEGPDGGASPTGPSTTRPRRPSHRRAPGADRRRSDRGNPR